MPTFDKNLVAIYKCGHTVSLPDDFEEKTRQTIEQAQHTYSLMYCKKCKGKKRTARSVDLAGRAVTVIAPQLPPQASEDWPLDTKTVLKEARTLSELARELDIPYDSLAKAAREGRIQARQSGSTWLSTISAIKIAIEAGTLRPRNRLT